MIEVRADVEVHLWCSTRLGFMIKTPHCLHFNMVSVKKVLALSYFMVVGFVKFSVVFFFLKGEIFNLMSICCSGSVWFRHTVLSV